MSPAAAAAAGPAPDTNIADVQESPATPAGKRLSFIGKLTSMKSRQSNLSTMPEIVERRDSHRSDGM